MFRDARTYQILFLALFLFLGIGTRDWTLRPEMVGVAIATCLVTQWLAMAITRQKTEFSIFDFRFSILTGFPSPPFSILPLSPSPPLPTRIRLRVPLRSPNAPTAEVHSPFSSFPSALITALGLSLLLRSDHYGTMVLAAVVAILSKFVLQVHGKHLFNPANIGIVAAILLTQDAWISPGQWGEERWYALLFLGAGGVVLSRVGRWDTTGAFLGSYALLEAGRNFWLGWTWDVWAHRLMSGSLLLFALFMVTDPRTIPNAGIGRIIWACAIALLTFILRNVFFIPTAVFWALFALTPLTPLLDWIWPASRFTWTEPAQGKGEMTAGQEVARAG